MKNDFIDGANALHGVFHRSYPLMDVVSKLIEVGGRELLATKVEIYDYFFTAFHYGYFCVGEDGEYINARRDFDSTFSFIMKEYILAEIGGEFGVGGLFHGSPYQRVQDEIYEQFYIFLPALMFVIETLQDQEKPPILHAAIIAKAPLKVMENIINHFDYSILKKDSFNRYPLQVAMEEGLGWNEGLQDIVEATAVAQHQQYPSIKASIIYTAAKYGLEWKNHMKELAKANKNVDILMNGHDSLTGLRLFMVAAMGEKYDLSAIYGMMRMGPEMINTEELHFDGYDDTVHKRRRLL